MHFIMGLFIKPFLDFDNYRAKMLKLCMQRLYLSYIIRNYANIQRLILSITVVN
jgi:hypothetical protein